MLHVVPDFQCDRHARIPCLLSQPRGIGEEALVGTHLDEQGWEAAEISVPGRGKRCARVCPLQIQLDQPRESFWGSA